MHLNQLGITIHRASSASMRSGTQQNCLYFFIKKLSAYLIILLFFFTTTHLWANDTLSLIDIDEIYHVNSAPQALGFFPIPDTVSAENIIQYAKNTTPLELTTRPNFQLHKRYALYITVENKTPNPNWFIQVSHYLINKIDIFVQSDSWQTHSSVQTTQKTTSHNINMLGRAIPVTLNQDTSSKVLIVLSSDKIKRPIYIGLVSDNKYLTWSTKLDFIFLVAIGIVVGFVLLSVTCFVIAHDQTFLWFAASTSLILYLSILRSPFGINFIDASNGLPYWLWLVIGFMQISILLFVRSFFSNPTQNKPPIIYNIVIGLILLTILVSLVTTSENNARLFAISSLIVVLLVIAMGFLKAKKDGVIYTIFMLGWLPLAFTICKSIYIQNLTPEANEVTLSYYNVEGPYFQVLHFFLHFIAMVLRILSIKKQKIEAEVKSEAKTTFLVQLSHDFRQPLDAMGLMLDHLNDKSHSCDSKQLISKTKQLHTSMQFTFSALTELSQLESGKVKLVLQNVFINDIVQELKNEHELAFHQKNLKLICPATKHTIVTDRTLLKRILNNLLSNAYKYTNKGGVLLSVRIRKNHLLLQVWDTGCGIPADQHLFIFDIYSQVQASTNKVQGSGIGLATVKHLSELLSYTVSLTSVIDKGSVFNLQIPLTRLKQANDEVKQLAIPKQKHPIKVDVVSTISKDTVNNELKIINAITEVELANTVTKHLASWAYESVCVDINTILNQLSQFISNYLIMIQADDTLAINDIFSNGDMWQYLQQNTNLFVVCFTRNAELLKLQQNEINLSNFHVLTTPINMAQFRAFLRHVEVNSFR